MNRVSVQESVYETVHFEVYYTKYIMDVEIFWEWISFIFCFKIEIIKFWF